MNKLGSLTERLLAVRLLQAARAFYKLTSLAEMLGIDASILSRYINGQVIPSLTQSRYLINSLRKAIDLRGLVLREAESPNGMIDPTLPLMDKNLLALISIEFYLRWRNQGITKILVPETSGVVLAASLAQLLDSDVVVARKRKTNPSLKWVEAHVSMPPNINRSFYLPFGRIKKHDTVLVVDDFVKSGYTLAATVQLVRQIGADIAGVVSLIVFGTNWRKVSGLEEVDSIVYI